MLAVWLTKLMRAMATIWKFEVRSTSLIVYKQEYSKQELRTRRCSQVRLTELSGAYSPPHPPSPYAKFASQGDAHMMTDTHIKFLHYPLPVSLFATKIFKSIFS